ncbi:hypothetical protein RHMOL_Rhmol12G0012500 [Rhododendron molle]|uniref:Uncharacterized protein n=1 Tax=Rhododendron molle TaxID=49168 RepID=A0ACC0LDP5_RHOML|nr:hypothetical protein RHMOL_Rhmol12G0012500 [Rhododendron molle]
MSMTHFAGDGTTKLIPFLLNLASRSGKMISTHRIILAHYAKGFGKTYALLKWRYLFGRLYKKRFCIWFRIEKTECFKPRGYFCGTLSFLLFGSRNCASSFFAPYNIMEDLVYNPGLVG